MYPNYTEDTNMSVWKTESWHFYIYQDFQFEDFLIATVYCEAELKNTFVNLYNSSAL